ncbi:ankyrin repeat-containing protein [Anaeramoeba flamelloides]|uniref:Ankyrin repeat-containing protein n=1 Tax=Anaeramoeba flamelloides TaxID=1746091 RepID=A0AAV7YKQ3_9EUKA|nr:ankyrin repeat-containing protein [Anaeramoeba flamelloides]
MKTDSLTGNHTALNIFLSRANPSPKFIKILLAKFQNKSRLQKLKIFIKSENPLHTYINKNNPSFDIIKLLIEDCNDINSQTQTGNTPLHIYCMRERPLLKVIGFLTQNGADLNLKNDKKETPIFLLANKCNENTSKLIMFFIKSGVTLTFPNYKRQTILHKLMFHKNCVNETLMLILNHLQEKTEKLKTIIDFNQQDLNGNTILHLYCRHQRVVFDTFHLLLKFGSNPTLFNNNCNTPLDLYLQNKYHKGSLKKVYSYIRYCKLFGFSRIIQLFKSPLEMLFQKKSIRFETVRYFLNTFADENIAISEQMRYIIQIIKNKCCTKNALDLFFQIDNNTIYDLNRNCQNRNILATLCKNTHPSIPSIKYILSNGFSTICHTSDRTPFVEYFKHIKLELLFTLIKIFMTFDKNIYTNFKYDCKKNNILQILLRRKTINLKIVKFFLKGTVDINNQNKMNETPLILFIKNILFSTEYKLIEKY